MSNTIHKVRNIVLHTLFLAALFVVSVLFFSRMINQVSPDAAETMKECTFPLVYMQRGGVNFNCLHGYSQEMDVSRMRDGVTPLSADRTIDILIQGFSASVERVSYEVIAIDTKEVLENTQVIKLDQDNDYLSATLNLQSNFLMNREYALKIQLTTGGRVLWYYTRILLADGLHTDDYLNYVSGFYDKTVNRTDLNTIGAAVEPDETTDEEQTLAYMDIHDSVSQLTWADLRPQIYYKPTPQICEINRNTATLSMEYRIAAVGESGTTEIYNVREYYRVRYTDSRVFLLNFERTTEEVFNPENSVLDKKGIRLGVRDKNVSYMTDPRQRVIAFIQGGELWTYENAGAKLTRVFGFPQDSNMDYRDFYQGSKIRILKVSSEGDVWFIVTGYMNRGMHEGGSGVSLCFYEQATDTVDEKVFLQSSEPHDLLERDTNGLAYVTQDNSIFYLLQDEQLFRVDLRSRGYDILAENVHENCFAGSSEGRYFAWLEEGEEYASSTLSILDLETGEQRSVTAPEGEKIRPVCYLKEDLIYGYARDTDLAEATLGSGYFPMYRLMIEDGEGNVLKDYKPAGCYVTDAVVSDSMLALTRVRRIPGRSGFVSADPDQIVNTDTADTVSVGIATEYSSRKQTQVLLRTGSSISAGNPEVIRSKMIAYETPRTMLLPEKTEREKLFSVYARSVLQRRFARPNEAVALADSLVGVVVNEIQEYVWVRGDKTVRAEIELKNVPDAMRGGIMDTDRLEKATGKRAIDLSGCTLDQVLYFVSHGMPVIALTAEGARVIVGYDEYNTCLLRPGEDEWYYYGMNDSTQLFEESGNIFVTLL